MAVMVVMDMDLMVVIIMDKVLIILLSKVISAEGEHKASRALKHAADVLMDNSGAMQVLIVMNLLISNQISISTFYIHFLKSDIDHGIIPVALSSNVDQHLSREQLHHSLPCAGWRSSSISSLVSRSSFFVFFITIIGIQQALA